MNANVGPGKVSSSCSRENGKERGILTVKAKRLKGSEANDKYKTAAANEGDISHVLTDGTKTPDALSSKIVTKILGRKTVELDGIEAGPCSRNVLLLASPENMMSSQTSIENGVACMLWTVLPLR